MTSSLWISVMLLTKKYYGWNNGVRRRPGWKISLFIRWTISAKKLTFYVVTIFTVWMCGKLRLVRLKALWRGMWKRLLTWYLIYRRKLRRTRRATLIRLLGISRRYRISISIRRIRRCRCLLLKPTPYRVSLPLTNPKHTLETQGTLPNKPSHPTNTSSAPTPPSSARWNKQVTGVPTTWITPVIQICRKAALTK